MGRLPERVLFVHAHPDDETLATGGTIASLIDQGVAVTVVTCTRGEQGEVIPPELKHLQGDAPALAAHRMGELAKAIRILGVTDHRYLGDADARQPGLEPRRYLDSGMAWGPEGAQAADDIHPEALCTAPFGEVAADLATVIASVRPDAVVSYDERGGYGHPDHVLAHEASLRAAEVLGVPFFAVDADGASGVAGNAGSTFVLDVSDVLARKADALRAHRTQVVVDGDHYSLSSGPPRQIASREGYRKVGAAAEPTADFEGERFWSKAATCVVSLIVGIGAGLLATVNHQASVTVFGVPVPFGVFAALFITGALVIGLRLVFDHRAPPTFATIGLLAVVVLFAQAGPGGSVLIPANEAGYAWSYGAPLLCALILVWPRIRRRVTG